VGVSEAVLFLPNAERAKLGSLFTKVSALRIELTVRSYMLHLKSLFTLIGCETRLYHGHWFKN
jgi:hypothetical protein